MSNRTLIEINHDFHGQIQMQPHEFVAALCRYLNSASEETAKPLKRFGVRVFGIRRHYDGFEIKWGAHEANEKAAPDEYQS